MIGSALPKLIAPVADNACKIPTEAEELWITAVRTAPAIRPRIGLENIVNNAVNSGTFASGFTADDDAIRAVKLIIGVMANSIVEAQGGKLIDFVTTDKEVKDASEIMQKAVDSVKKKEDRPRRFEEGRNNKRQFDNKRSSEKVEAKKEVKTEEQPKEEKTEEKANVDLSTKTVNELRDMAKEKDIKGYSTMKKAELIEALN